MSQTIPILPIVNYDFTCIEYEKLGFEIDTRHRNNGYLIITLNDVEIHFTLHSNLSPKNNYSSCYIRTNLVDELYEKWHPIINKYNGIPRIDKIENKPWGMREFAYIDNNGNLLRIGKINE